MEGEREVHRNTFFLFHHLGPESPGCEIVGIISRPVAGNGAVHAGPLHPIMCSFHIARNAGQFPVPFKFAHAASELDSICTHAVGAVASVVQQDISFISFVEFESAEINPRTSAAFLIYGEMAFSAHVIYGITCLRCAVLKRCIGDIDRVFAPFREIRSPFCKSIRL